MIAFPDIACRLLRLSLLLTSLCFMPVGCERDEGAAVDADYLAYDNQKERNQFFVRINRQREREFAVPRIQRRWLENIASVGILEDELSIAADWLDTTLGTVDSPRADAAERARNALAGPVEAPPEVNLLLQHIRADAEEGGWSWEADEIDSPVALLREIVGGLETARAALGDPEAELPDAARGSLAEHPGDELAALRAWFTAEALIYPGPEMFVFASPADLPETLQDEAGWTTNEDAPEVGSDEAIKGGALRTFVTSFPETIRHYGPNSNNSFRGEHKDNVELGMTEFHPNTGEVIPMLADRWYVADDGRTVFFHIDERATFSDGKPVTTDDVLTMFFVRLSPYTQDPWGAQYYRDEFVQVVRYDEQTVALTRRTAKPRELMPYFCDSGVAPTHFYTELGPDFPQRYQWRPVPSTGAYVVDMERTVFGRQVVLARVEDWWRRDLRYTRNRYNADTIRYQVVQDLTKAWEVFRIGDLDYFSVTLPDYWYGRSETDVVFDGYVERAVFFNVYPRVPRGLYLNTARPPLDDRRVRVGIACATDWQTVIDQEFRGDARRLNYFTEGYALLEQPNITARAFDPARAREHFAAAGFTEVGSDGILRRPDGTRLSVRVLFYSDPVYQRIVGRLVERARLAGLELVMDARDGVALFTAQQEKRHEISLSGWGFSPPAPQFYEFLHSSNARNADGSLKQQTNNIFSWGRPDSDRLVEDYRAAPTLEEAARLASEINQLMHEEALYVPGFTFDYSRVAFWRWLRWPEDFSLRTAYAPIESYVWWLDSQRREQTLEARLRGEIFPEVLEIYDQYRQSEAREPSADAISTAPPGAAGGDLEAGADESGSNSGPPQPSGLLTL